MTINIDGNNIEKPSGICGFSGIGARQWDSGFLVSRSRSTVAPSHVDVVTGFIGGGVASLTLPSYLTVFSAYLCILCGKRYFFAPTTPVLRQMRSGQVLLAAHLLQAAAGA